MKNSLLYKRAIQGHTGEELIAPELSGHVFHTMEGIHLSQRMFFRLYFNSQVTTRCWRKSE